MSLDSLLSTSKLISSSIILPSFLPVSKGRRSNLLLSIITPSIISFFLDCHYLPFHWFLPLSHKYAQILKQTHNTHLPLKQLPSFSLSTSNLSEQFAKSMVPGSITSYLLLNQPLLPLETQPHCTGYAPWWFPYAHLLSQPLLNTVLYFQLSSTK